ncbi:MAG: hypothetical protein IT428_19050 [Planctomycetaceae bacterium]|nr:hypothetical protein [Planctomycetaceae bacterium]
MWADKDGSISKDDVLKRFDAIDADKDGKLSKSELDAHRREVWKKFHAAHSAGRHSGRHHHGEGRDGAKDKKPADEPKKDEGPKDAPKGESPKAESKAATDGAPATAEVPVAAAEISDAPAIAELAL